MNTARIKENRVYKFFFNPERKSKGKIKAFFSQLSRGLMIPIAILPVAGLLLGIGGAIEANFPGSNEAAQVFAKIFKGMSDVVFSNLPILFCIAITITFSKDKGTAGFMSALAYLVFCSVQLAFIQTEKVGEVTKVVSILWFHKDNIEGITGTTLGMITLQTSVFGGVIVGGLASLIYNYFSKVKLPTALDFFSGVRLVPFILIPSMLGVALVFLLFWPWVGALITIIGSGIQQAPRGTGGLLYGILGRSLMPFGLHHIPIIMALQTDFGGVLDGAVAQKAFDVIKADGVTFTPAQVESITALWAKFSGGAGKIAGDQNIWNFINGIGINTINGTPIFEWFSTNVGVYAGRFMQDYPTYLGACLGIGAAIIFTAEKANRKKIAAVIGSSMGVAFLTGITEPLEFSFLFVTPLLYYLIYVPISGFSYMFMELAGAHVGVGFARGFIDLMIYGALPVAKGTQFWWTFVIAPAEGLLMFGAFWLCIKKFDLPTPGRKDNPMNLITKKDYQAMKQGQSGGTPDSQAAAKNERILKIVEALGGFENIEDCSACATRLRVTFKDKELIKQDLFIETGSKGVVLKDKGIQVIYGGEAGIIADNVNDLLLEHKNEFKQEDQPILE